MVKYKDMKEFIKDLEPNTVLFAAPYTKENLEKARDYCRLNKFTFDEVKIAIHEEEKNIDFVLVITK